MKKLILVTGGFGMIGSAIGRLTDVDNSNEFEYIFIGGSEHYDLTNPDEADSLLFCDYPNAYGVIHLAAKVGGIKYNITNPCDLYEDNIMMNTNMVKLSRYHGVKRFIGVLSTCAYPNVAESYPMTEDMMITGTAPAPTNLGYGYAKRMMAVHIEACNKQYGTKYNYVIPSNVYGIGDNYSEHKSHFIGALIRKIHIAKTTGADSIKIGGTGIAKRQFMYCDDVARAIITAMEKDISESFNICSVDNLSITEITNIALKACSAEHLKIEYDSSIPDGQIMKEASNSKMMQLMPDFKYTSLEDGIKIAYQEYKQLLNAQ